MARGAQNQAQQTFGESQDIYNSTRGNVNQLYERLFPQYEQEATNPQGFAPQDLAAMNTASQQSVGGSTAGAVGEGNLEAARTRNSGAFAPALDSAVRSGQQTLSQNALGIQGENAALKQEQQQAGLSGLAGLYGQNSQDMLSALGLENQSTNALTSAGQSGWFQNTIAAINALKGGGGGGGGVPGLTTGFSG